MKALTLIFLLCGALLFIGCSKTDNANTANANNSNANSNAKPAATTKAADTASTGTSIGVAACDEYLAKVEKCMNNPNVPEAAKAAYKSSMEQNRAAWKQAASTPQGKASLETSCKTAMDSAQSFFATCK
jgi:hypothetical protein